MLLIAKNQQDKTLIKDQTVLVLIVILHKNLFKLN